MRYLIFIFSASLSWGQCVYPNPSACPNSGSPSGFTGNLPCPAPVSTYCPSGLWSGDSASPAIPYRAYVQGASTNFPNAAASVSTAKQSRVTYSGQIIPVEAYWMISDPNTCPTSGTCLYNNATVATAYVHALTAAPPAGLGLTSVDINAWMSPIVMSAQYSVACTAYIAAGGGSSCSAIIAHTCPNCSSVNLAWWTNSLGTYDAVIAALPAGVMLRMAPQAFGDFWGANGISTTYPATPTEAQIQDALVPALMAWAARYSISQLSLAHEPCGAMEASLNTAGCALTVAQWHTLLVTGIANVPLHQANPAMLLGSGVCYLDNGYAYVSDWNTIAGLGFVDIHVYGWGNPATYFSSMLAQYSAWAATTQAAHQLVVAGESMWPQWVPSNQVGMNEAYQGFGSSVWWTNGVGPLWLRDVAGVWARGNGFSVWSVWSNEPFFYSSTNPNNTVTYPGLSGDTYEPSAMTAVVAGASLTPLGQMFARFIHGTVASGQSRATVNGRTIVK